MPIALHKEQEMAAYWKTQIELSDKENRRWHKRGKKICEKYRDERGESDENPSAKDMKRTLNLFWSNVQMLKPALYSKTPVPICERRFLDKDTTGRVASTILERALRYEVAMCGFHEAVKRARDDYLLPGRGQVWVRYNPKFGEPISEQQVAEDEIEFEGSEKPQEEQAVEETESQERELIAESLYVDYIHWQDYGTLPPKARTEEEVEGKFRRIFMSRQDLMERFGDEIGKKIPLDHVPTDDDKSGPAQSSAGRSNDDGQATIYEIWWKPDRKIYFIAKEYDQCLVPEGFDADEDGGIDDPLKLEDFFPCPAPLTATMTNDTLIPVPDYVESQDQYIQIDSLTKRIDILTNACMVRGVYDASAQGLKRVFEEGVEPSLIPVESWAMFAEKGGLKGAIDWVPIEDIAATLKLLIETRSQIMEDLDHVTGINDINRGTSDARETLGGVRIKQNSTSGRLQERQEEVAEFCRDIIAIMAEIIAVHYDPQTLIEVSGALYDEGLDPPAILPQVANAAPVPPPPPSAPGAVPTPVAQMPQPGVPPTPAGQQSPIPSAVMPQETPEQKQQRKFAMIMDALELLRSDKMRGFRIDIETDSTIEGDAQEEKQSRIEFIEGVTKFIETAGQVTMTIPEFAPLAAKMLQFAVRGFRVGRDLESAIEDFAEKAELDAKEAAANPQQKQSPEQLKVQAEQVKGQFELQRQQLENQGEMQNSQNEIRMKEMDMQMRNQEFEMKKLEFQIKMKELGVEMAAQPEADENHPIVKAAKVFDLASKRNAAPKRIMRDAAGKATHIITDFKEG